MTLSHMPAPSAFPRGDLGWETGNALGRFNSVATIAVMSGQKASSRTQAE